MRWFIGGYLIDWGSLLVDGLAGREDIGDRKRFFSGVEGWFFRLMYFAGTSFIWGWFYCSVHGDVHFIELCCVGGPPWERSIFVFWLFDRCSFGQDCAFSLLDMYFFVLLDVQLFLAVGCVYDGQFLSKSFWFRFLLAVQRWLICSGRPFSWISVIFYRL